MGTTTVTPVITSRKDKNGLYPIKIRVTQNRKSKYFPLKVSVKKSDWSPSKRRVKTTHPNHTHINNLITVKLSDFDNLTQSDSPIVSRTNVFDFIDTIIERKGKTKFHTPKRYQTLCNHLHDFHGNRNLNFHDIDREFVLDFRVHLESNIQSRSPGSPPSPNTINNYLKVLRTVVNEGIEQGRFFGQHPFTRGVIPQKTPTNKKSLSPTEIQKLNNLEPVDSSGFTKGMFDSLNVFMFGFWSQGLRVGDILQLRYSDIHHGQFVVNMDKTERTVWIPITNFNSTRVIPYLPILPHFRHSVFTPHASNLTDHGTSIDSYLYGFYEEREKLIQRMKEELKILWGKRISSDKYVIRFDKPWTVFDPEFLEEFKQLDRPWLTEPRELTKDRHLHYVHLGVESLLELSSDPNLKNTFIFPHLRGMETSSELDRSKKISSCTALINKNLKKVSKLLEVSPFTTHTSRHTFTTLSKEMGSDVYDIKRYLGHTSVRTTENYIHTLESSNPGKLSVELKDFIYSGKRPSKG